MRLYMKNDDHEDIFDKKGKREYIEIPPCPRCKTFSWSDDERGLVQNAVELIRSLSAFEFNKSCASSAKYSKKGSNDAIWLDRLLNPPREPFEYDNDEIGLIQRVLQLAAFAGPANIDIKLLDVIYAKIEKLVVHIECKKHPDDDTPWSWFDIPYLSWIGEQQLLSFLPGIRGKTKQEIVEYLKKKWDRLERCMKCNKILRPFEVEKNLSGFCRVCESPHEDASTTNTAHQCSDTKF